MKDDYHSFYRDELFENWYTASHNFFQNKNRKTQDFESISPVKPASSSRHARIQLDRIESDSEYRSLLLNEAIPYEHPQICENTFLLYDLSDHTDTPYHTLVFSYHEAPRKSFETTSDIMLRLAEDLRTPLEWSKLIGESLGYKQRIPYIAGETILLPERGYSKRPSSWLVLDQVQQAEYESRSNTIYLYLNYHHQLQVSGEKRSFMRQVERACNIYAVQNRLYQDILELGSCTLQPLPVIDKNIVQRHLALHPSEKPKFTFYEYFHYLILYLSNQQLHFLFDEENPYLEDIQQRFQIF